MQMAAEETFVPGIDDAADYDSVEATPEPAETDGAGQETAAPEVETKPAGDTRPADFFPDDPELEEYLQREIKRGHRLDPKNPEDLKSLRRMAEQERYIQKLKGGAKPDDGDGDEAAGDDSVPEAVLTEFERSLLGTADKPKTEDEKPAKEEDANPQSQGEPVSFNWRDPNDAYQDLSGAWSEIAQEVNSGKAPNFSKINQIDAAIFDRRMEALNLPGAMQQIARQAINEMLGDILPDVRQSAAQSRIASTKEFAVQQLTATPGYEGVSKMFDAEDGQPITISGEQFPRTPFSRAVAKAPWILDIHKHDPSGDRTKSDRLTAIARFRAAHDVLQGNGVNGSAKKLIAAGAKLASRSGSDPARQGLNSGSGTNSLSNPSSGGSNYIDELMSTEDRIDFSSLFSK